MVCGYLQYMCGMVYIRSVYVCNVYVCSVYVFVCCVCDMYIKWCMWYNVMIWYVGMCSVCMGVVVWNV